MEPVNRIAIHINAISFVTGAYSGINSPEKLNKADKANWFDSTAWLGKKGHRYHSEPVKYASAAAKQLNLAEKIAHSSAVFIGTDSIDLMVRKKIALRLSNQSNQSNDIIGAAFAPNCSVNIAAGQLSAKYNLHGANYTFTGADASCIALWQAFHALQRGEISSALVGQVEYKEEQVDRSGAVLWHLSDQKTSAEQISIELLQWQRWLPEYGTTFDFIVPAVPNKQGPDTIYVVGQQSVITDELIKQLAQHHDLIERINIPAFAEELLPSMRLFSTLSYIVLKKVRGTVLLVSDKGHIFNFNLY